MVEGHGSASGTVPPPFVVGPDRAHARRHLRIAVVVGAIVVILNILQVLLADTAWEAIWVGGTALAFVGVVASQVVMWRRFLAADVLAEVGPAGIRVHVLRRGWVSLPWDAVGGVRTDWARRVVVKPAAGVDPSTPGTDWPPHPATVRRARRRGLFIATVPSDTDAPTVRAAISHFSGGRL